MYHKIGSYLLLHFAELELEKIENIKLGLDFTLAIFVPVYLNLNLNSNKNLSSLQQ